MKRLLFILPFFFSSLSAQTITDYVAYWSMYETSGDSVHDLSANLNHGIATGTTIVDGRLGKARDFNGSSDFVTMGDSATFEFSPSITVSCWIYARDRNESDAFISRWDEGIAARTWALAFGGTLGDVRFDTSPDGGFYGGNKAITTDTPIGLNIWYHIVGCCDGTTNKVYVNGIEKATTTISNSGLFTTGAAVLNLAHATQIAGSTTQYFNGVIDDARIYDRALSATEVTMLYNFGGRKARIIN